MTSLYLGILALVAAIMLNGGIYPKGYAWVLWIVFFLAFIGMVLAETGENK